jgi:hypothetical protein
VTAPGAADAGQRLQRDYRPAFLRYLSRRDEPARHAGYLLGRTAVAAGRSVLDVVAAHHVTLLEVLPDARDPDEVLAMSTAASEFLTEVLASFSMTSGAFAAMAEQLEDAQRELAGLRARVTPDTG